MSDKNNLKLVPTDDEFIIYWENTKRKGLVKYILGWIPIIFAVYLFCIFLSFYRYYRFGTINGYVSVQNYLLSQSIDFLIMMVPFVVFTWLISNFRYRHLIKANKKNDENQ